MRRLKRVQIKGVHISVHPDFYNNIEIERRRFMKKMGLTNLSTKAFTGILARKIIRK